MKTCYSCQATLPLDQFNRSSRAKDGLQGTCRECNRSASRRYYQRNRSKHLQVVREKKKEYQARNQEWVLEYLAEHPCIDCGEDDPLVLEFDHRGDKELDVSKMVINAVSLTRLESEVGKCDVRCANCHRRKTAQTQGHLRYRLLGGVANDGLAPDF